MTLVVEKVGHLIHALMRFVTGMVMVYCVCPRPHGEPRPDTNDGSDEDRKEGYARLLNLAASISEHICFAVVSQISTFERPINDVSAFDKPKIYVDDPKQ